MFFYVNSYQALNKNDSLNEIYPPNLNSKNILEYLKEENLENKINKICSKDICKIINNNYLKSEIKSFIEENISYLKNKNEERSIDAELKGFKINKIIIYN